MTIAYVSFDPGKTTGWAAFDEKGEVTGWGQVTLEELIDLCRRFEHENLTAIVYEDYVVYKHKAQAHTGSRVEAAQAIGIIKSLIKQTNAIAIRQDSSIKGIAQKWTQLKPPADHSQSHWVDAFNHGAYYLINEGIRQTELERSRNGNV